MIRKNSFLAIVTKQNFYLSFILLLLTFILLGAYEVCASSYGSEIRKDNYVISRSMVSRDFGVGEVFLESFNIFNLGGSSLKVSFSHDSSLDEVIEFRNESEIIGPNSQGNIDFFIKGKEIGNYSGKIYLTGDLKEEISVNLTISDQASGSPFLLKTELMKNTFILGKYLEFRLIIHKLKSDASDNVSIDYYLNDNFNNSYFLGSENLSIPVSVSVVRKFNLPLELEQGYHALEIKFRYGDNLMLDQSPVFLKISFFKIKVFDTVPMWAIFLFFSFILVLIALYFIFKRMAERKRKYKMSLDFGTIPKKTEGFFFLGKIAEKRNYAYLDPLKLKTHCIVAGATGGGKSIAAQVIIEEALLNNVAVIVFDPTAQWSGMLRKCDDKKMFAFYPNFGLKESDAKAFKGNVRQVKNARELIDINKHINPGQIQIFTLNKLDPKDMDTFVASIIRQVFRSDPKETPDLKLLLVFDEVHRLLSKFGGSGEGFLQVERACREFRKWGMGVMLISQVLSDFVGEIKANISTEVQMRTRDEGDLNRIKNKYGEDFLQSLVKASIGVGMFVNPSYNHAQPYFIGFRPILHNTRRLSDEELEKYNNYNDLADDMEYQIEQLEAEKIDVFDLKMELKLVKDKLMSGNFSVVDIYLEGLKPRIEKEWENLGKKPKKRELILVAEEEIKKSIEEARQARAKAEKEAPKEAPKEEKKEDIDTKEVTPLIFDNGIMVSSLKELKSILPGLDEEIFGLQVNDKKNDIAEWLKQIIPPAEAESLKNILDKNLLLAEIKKIGKENVILEKKAEETKNCEEKSEIKGEASPEKKESAQNNVSEDRKNVKGEGNPKNVEESPEKKVNIKKVRENKELK
jgi:hypothetical protein